MDNNLIFEEPAWVQSQHLSTVPLTPLEERIAAEKPHLLENLQKLKTLLGTEAFDRYISPVQTLNQSGQTLLLIARNAMHRSHIVRECIPAIKAAFGATIVRVIGG